MKVIWQTKVRDLLGHEITVSISDGGVVKLHIREPGNDQATEVHLNNEQGRVLGASVLFAGWLRSEGDHNPVGAAALATSLGLYQCPDCGGPSATPGVCFNCLQGRME